LPAVEQLEGRYRELAERYREMLWRLGDETRGARDLQRLSSWAMRLPSVGLALIRDGAVVVCNLAFTRLNQTTRGPLLRVAHQEGDGAGRYRFRDLRELATLSADKLGAPPSRLPVTTRYRALGNERWIDVVFDRLYPTGSNPATVAAFHDVTDRVQTDDALAAAREVLARQQDKRAMGELAAGIVHDVSNTMAAIRLRLSALRRDPDCMAAQGSNVDALQRIVTEGSELLQRLQNLGEGDGAGNPEPVDLRECVVAAIEVAQSGLRYRAIHDGIDIRIENAVPVLPKIKGWPHDLQRVFVNLLINARDAMPLGGLIRVTGAEAGKEVLIKVEDDGTGIPAAVMPHIFDAYFTTKGAGGTGLGLTMVERAMARHGGSTTAGNRNGGGAVFTLRFPKPAAATRRAPVERRATTAVHLPNLPD
jgi:signal transduction histidine kinase